MLSDISQLLSRFDPATGEIAGAKVTCRHLLDLKGCFADVTAFAAAADKGNPLIYSVATVERASGAGDLHFGIGRLMPGRIGREYYFTKGHMHSWREAAEIYVGISGEGEMLLEDHGNGDTHMVPLLPNCAVYVPGNTAHRTVNTGSSPLIYMGIYPAAAGHDYRAIAEQNFRCIVIQEGGRPVLRDRANLHALPDPSPLPRSRFKPTSKSTP